MDNPNYISDGLECPYCGEVFLESAVFVGHIVDEDCGQAEKQNP